MPQDLFTGGLEDIGNQAYDFYNDPANAPQWYSDPNTGQPLSTVTPFQPAQVQGQEALLNAADQYGAPLSQQYAQGAAGGLPTYQQGVDALSGYAAGTAGLDPNVGNATLNQNYLQGYNNPFLNQVADQIGGQAQAGAINAAGQAGVTGSARAARAAALGRAQATAPLYASAYDQAFQGAQQAGLQDAQLRQQASQQNQANQLNAANQLGNFGFNWAQQAPNAYSFAQAPGQTYSNVGAAQQQQGQNELNADINRFNYYQQLPQQQLNQMLGLTALQQAGAGGTGAGGSTGNTVFDNLLNLSNQFGIDIPFLDKFKSIYDTGKNIFGDVDLLG